ncbi:hypothetical protein BHE97_12015 [Aeromicrobium sp. PE09-221]|uniref:TetR/AcrR family transcriptional regulator n=1 Tax=Aeromicrobium sp. PE09-221 TaxID=1898043 RepID=UPI000B3EA06D|nr:TetR/AcrR family transcriptional regulator [Aeromicrobium sp. PE09-221]OUZ08853.1 hypothetical protein BHE97_12015 [Aeromicrobium sp. PE09-221]
MSTPKSEETKRRLVRATIASIEADGLAKVSARSIAERAGLAQGLIFYHFGSVVELIGEACLTATQERVDRYAEQFDAVDTFTGLVDLATRVRREERESGNVAILGQALAAAQTDPAMAEVSGTALDLWTDQVREVTQRVLVGSPFAELIAADELAHLVSSAFIGIELTAPMRTAEADGALTTLGSLAHTIDGLGPVARRAIRAALR